jgi:shikimate dehydrogenase
MHHFDSTGVDTYAVVGNPIRHSQSPFIHEQFAKQTHQAMRYIKVEIPTEQFAVYVRTFLFEQHGKGLNITAPFKQQAFVLATSCSQRAQVAKSVNTIKLSHKEILGDNTDGIGFMNDLTQNHHYELSGKRILILGAGGAVRGILSFLIAKQPHIIVLANRTLSKAHALLKDFTPSPILSATALDAIWDRYDLIINAISASLYQDELTIDPKILAPKAFCYDLMYGHKATPFLQWALSHGVKHMADGTGMLVEQAAESFYWWRGIRPDTQTVIAKLMAFKHQ